jgi:hypothetical protein
MCSFSKASLAPMLAAAAVVAVSSVLPAQGGRQAEQRARQTEQNAFQWSGELAPGQRLYLHNLNGNVTVEAAAGRNLEVTASKSWRRGNPADVRFDASRVDGGRDVVVCAIWNDPSATCTSTGVRGGSERRSNRNNDTEVTFRVKLPAGANVTVNNTNGDLTVSGVSGDISAFTTNGNVIAESSEGAVQATTSNGNIRVKAAKLPANGATYNTHNGNITVELPDGVNLNLVARTMNGGVNSDFDVTATGSFSPRSLRGRIGSGGPVLTLTTSNGNISIRRR